VRTRTSFGSVAVQHHLTPEFLADLERARQRYHDEWVSANLVKFFADGGTGLIPPLAIPPMITKLWSRNSTRAATNHDACPASRFSAHDSGYLRASGTGARARDRRLRVEHADLVDAVDLPRFARLSVIADMQPSFCCGDDGGNFDPADEVPSDRWRSLQASGAVLAFQQRLAVHLAPRPIRVDSTDRHAAVWKSADTANIAGGPLDGAGQGGAVSPARSTYTRRAHRRGRMRFAPTRKVRRSPLFPTRSRYVDRAGDTGAALTGSVERPAGDIGRVGDFHTCRVTSVESTRMGRGARCTASRC